LRVFVLNGGRCGSGAFYEACRNVTNYSSAHTSRQQLLGDARVDFPDNHIELGNRLVWFLGRLDERFGCDAFYVHLQRDPEAVARSYASRLSRAPNSGIISAYASQIARQEDWDEALPICEDYVRTVTENIRLFLKDKPHRMDFRIENADEDWPIFWQEIGAEGDFDAAIGTFAKRINTTEQSIARERKQHPTRVLRKLRSWARSPFRAGRRSHSG
jgi:hypothetical protein